MFVVSLHYLVDLPTAESHLDAHIEYVKRQYEAGVFLASGAKVPRTGGVILATAPDREHLETILAEDPFALAKIARYDITEFNPTMTSERLAWFKS